MKYVWSVRRQFGGHAGTTAVEVHPRSGELLYWRFAVPADVPVAAWGHGPAKGDALAPLCFSRVEGGTGDYEGTPVTIFGSGDRLSPSISAFVIFEDRLPGFVFFGPAAGPFESPEPGEVLPLAALAP